MPLALYNTLTRQKELFQPLKPGRVSLYVCGPTVYDRAHIGNARPVVIFDTLFRLLKLRFQVTYVRNITDIDDKIIQASERCQESIESLTTRTTDQFHEDMAALNALPVTLEPRATQHIPSMIDLIQMLLEKGYAYEAEGHVLFHTKAYESYGHLARRHLDQMLAGARVDVAPYKKDPMDFVLWKPSPPEIPGWPSPWGRGRPGWHIECSAMSWRLLGEAFDIHGGGADLLFPHHENERAQSLCAFGHQQFAQVWMHNGMVRVQGRKMSKSLNNFLTVHDLLKTHPGEVIRLVLLSAHYRQPLDWTPHGVHQATATLNKFYRCLQEVEKAQQCSGFSSKFSPQKLSEPHHDVRKALEDDLNVPLALSILHAQVSELTQMPFGEGKRALGAQFRASLEFLGLLKPEYPTSPASASASASEAPSPLMSVKEIEALIEERLKMRHSKNYAQADSLRVLLEENGVIVEDDAQGTTWRWKSEI